MTNPNSGALSDDEADPSAPQPNAPSDPEWLTFEKDVREALASKDPNATVGHDVKRVGKSGRERQIDTLVTGRICGEIVEIGVEATRYQRKVGIGVVDAFVGKCLDTGVDKGVLYSHMGFDGGAHARASVADHPKILLRELTSSVEGDGAEDLNPPWSDFVDEFLEVEPCPADDCWGEVWIRGDLGWSGGVCDSCGTACGYCRACGGVSALVSDQQVCDNCDEGEFEVRRDYESQQVDDVRWESMAVYDHPGMTGGRPL